MMPEHIGQCIFNSSKRGFLTFETHPVTSFDVGWAGDKLFKPLANQESEMGAAF